MAEQKKTQEPMDAEGIEDLDVPESESEDVKGGLQNLTSQPRQGALDLNDLYVKGSSPSN